MPIEGFDYKAFAIDLSKQAMEVLMQPATNAAPNSLTDADKKNIVETVKKFCFMAGEALSNDSQLKFNAEQASLVTQFIGEWTFHKSIDLINGKIPVANREPVLQIIAANIFNTAKLAIIKNMPQDALINLVEDKVKQVYADELQKLVKKGVLSEEQYNVAVNASNLNDMVQKTEEDAKAVQAQQQPASNNQDKKTLKLAALAVVLKKLPEQKVNQILNSLDKSDVQHVMNYMRMKNLEDRIDRQVMLKSLEEIKLMLPMSDSVNVPKLLKRHYKNLKVTPPQILSDIAMNEREAVKDFILDSKFDAVGIFSPYIIQSLVNSIETIINDN